MSTLEEDRVVDYYNNIAKQYDNDRFANTYGRFIDQQERRALDSLNVSPEGTLDLPCGTGRLTDYASEGADASVEMLKIAQKQHPDKQFTLTDACKTPFQDRSFETVLSFHFLMHLDEESVVKVLHEMHRIIAPGGRWICDIPSLRRRKLTNRKPELWHGNTSLDIKQMQELCHGLFEIRQVKGIMLAPIHRLPKFLRKPMCSIDYALANSRLLKEYSSYLIFELFKV